MRARYKIALVLLAVIAVAVSARLLPIDEALEGFNTWVKAQGTAGMILFGLAYALAAVFLLPCFLLTIGGGAAFGLLPGAVTVLVGATLGAALAFLVSRHLARRRVEHWVQARPSFAAVDEAVAREGWKIVLLTRLTPVFPFNFQNYAYGLTRVSFWHYTAASLVGMIPGVLIYTYIGTLGRTGLEATAGSERLQGLEFALQVLGLVATIWVTVLVTRIARKALKQAGVK